MMGPVDYNGVEATPPKPGKIQHRNPQGRLGTEPVFVSNSKSNQMSAGTLTQGTVEKHISSPIAQTHLDNLKAMKQGRFTE